MVLFWRHRKILIIEDNEDLVIFLKRILESVNYVVFSTTRGKGAVDLAIDKKPDVVILDIVLPDIGGEEVERLLKEEPTTRNIPIIYMTALVSREDEELAESSDQPRLLLSKPVTTKRLLKAIDLALSRK